MIELRGRSKVLQHRAAVDIAKGSLVPAAILGGHLNGVAVEAIELGAVGRVAYSSEIAGVTKVADDAIEFAAGEKVYYNTVAAKAAKSGVLIGYALEAADAADTEVVVEFDGSLTDSEGVTLSDISDLADLTIGDITAFGLKMSDITDIANLKLADLADVDMTGVTDNDRLAYDTASSTWIVEAVAD